MASVRAGAAGESSPRGFCWGCPAGLKADGRPIPTAFVDGLRALGYVEGKNLILEWRSAEGKYERYPEIFNELVSIKVDVIVTVNSLGAKIAKEATQTIPIVMIAITDPVGQGLVQSLARPGGTSREPPMTLVPRTLKSACRSSRSYCPR